MIELFDAEQLLPRRDWTPLMGLALVAGGVLVMSSYASSLQTQLQSADHERGKVEKRLEAAKAEVPPNATLVEDLKRQALLLETQLHGIADESTLAVLSPSEWVQRIASLGNSEISLLKIEVDRQGRARIEGMATTAQAVSAFVQAWSAQDRLAGVPARTLEVRQDKMHSELLRFTLHAHMPTPTGGAEPGMAAPAKAASAVATADTGGRS